MQGQLVHAAGLHGVDTPILPDIGPVAPVLAQLETVHMRGGAVLEGEDQLMTRAVERAHATIILGPDDQVLQRVVNGFACVQHFAHMTPVHADKMDRAIETVIGMVLQGPGQEGGELGSRHLARGHGEFAVPGLAGSADMTVDGDVIGRVGEHHPGQIALHQACHHIRIETVATDQPVPAKLPDIAGPDPCGSWFRNHIIGRIAILFGDKPVDQRIDLGHLEADDADVEVEIARHQGLQFFGQNGVIPAGIQGQLVVSKHIGALLLRAHMFEPNTRHGCHFQQLCGGHPAMAGKNGAIPVDQHRIGEAERKDTVGDLAQLLLRMGAGIARPGGQCRGGDLLDLWAICRQMRVSFNSPSANLLS